ncbi:ATP-binding protein [Lactonifactor longoviformis]|uniref:DNA segregation ATPase FtsK/SpoIIIE and related proteins n=1 Tax=Lactonifactor longoviformis DSM 17459 TaxID=1122155 RepID=A0A1M5CTS8_9CLOT|nr:ATP-binding protein [Lactonifactor longoviformis]POP33186.1 ATP-binding protein [Lactonifactor longoviformis]SHF58129.1 DNA segregation ATPase FtsK/SpoIIIE and related proteins [Lactonifactor longoviformis DSM 17459]
MAFYKYRGKRIRASDKSLVYRFCGGSLLFLFVTVILLLNMGQLMCTDWHSFSLIRDNGLVFSLSPYNFITIIMATGICILVAFLFYHFFHDRYKQLMHRQKLARMVLENGWYEAETIQDTVFFTDLSSGRSREKIVSFPRMYYRMEKGLLHIQCEITLGKYQDQLLQLEDKLESGLYCELIDKLLYDGYVEYTLLYDMIANRISIEEVQAENGGLRLMKNLVWKYDTLPHALICGGTGGGKTYFILTIIEALLRTNAVLYILDPKNADLADLGTVMDKVYYKKEDMVDCVNAFYDGMVARSEAMKLMPNYKTGQNYAYLGLAPHFLIFDEYVAFMECLTTKENIAILSQLKKIVMLGRQAGYFLILACQRPDAKYFSDGIRDNFNFRVALGRMSELGYGMMFESDTNKKFFQKRIKGRGYCDVGTSVISEFYTPLVPKEHDFLQTIGTLAIKGQDGQVACEAKATGTD